MIRVEIPSNYQPERHYILSVMLKEFLGLDIAIELSDRNDTKISTENKQELIIVDGLFNTRFEQWLKPESLPKQPLKLWNLETTKLQAKTVNTLIPVIYGDDPSDSNFFSISENKIYLGLDIFGSAFFMLTRYEEVVKNERDQHNRFPATASLAYQENFLDRPIINEYLEILWSCFKYLWPKIERKPRDFQFYLSHDVDSPFMYAFSGISRLIKRCGGDLVKRRDLGQALNNTSRWIKVKSGNEEADPHNTFDWIMDISEKHNLKSAFYFITDHSSDKMDGVYNINHPLICELLGKIHKRGHEIGLHPSYNTYKNIEQTKKEFQILKDICQKNGITQNYWGGRQHFLRWETPTTFQNWNDAGLDYDTTLSFADVAGFRCGICYEFSTFNLNRRQDLFLKERPLIVMECTIFHKRYMSIPIHNNLALKAIFKYKNICMLFNGNFTLLWHNSEFLETEKKQLYQLILE